MGTRMVQLVNSTSIYSDFTFRVMSASKKSFVVLVSTSSTYPVTYYKLVGDYFASSSTGTSFAYSSMATAPNCTQDNDTSSTLNMGWTYSQAWINSTMMP